MEAPLSGLRVVDMGGNLAGPFAPMVFSDLGADVIKVDELEPNRREMGRTGIFFGCQRGKRSLAMDVRSKEGYAILQKLLATADILHQNMRNAVPPRLGIDYETVRKLNPSIIYCHTSGWGEDGPYGDWPGWDQFAQATGGSEWEGGGVDAGNPPMWHRFGQCDATNAMHSALAVLDALFHREQTGEGQYVHTNIINGGLTVNSDYFEIGDQPAPRPTLDRDQRGTAALYRIYQTADGWVQIACLGEDEWQRLAAAIGTPELPADARFASAKARESNRKALETVLEPIFCEKTAAAWQHLFESVGVPSEVSDAAFGEKFFDDPENLDLEMLVRYPMEGYGVLQQFGKMINFSETPMQIFGPPPLRGEHTREILTELGYSLDAIRELKETGIIICPDVA